MKAIPVHIGKGLSDKAYDKRKLSAIQLEELVRRYKEKNDSDTITKILEELNVDYRHSEKEAARSGGVMGLATCAIALGSDDIGEYLIQILPPIVSTLTDPESRVRYYGCEALYNVAKVGRGKILVWFNEILDGLSKVITDPFTTVRESAEYVDRLVKDIVAEEASTCVVRKRRRKSVLLAETIEKQRKEVEETYEDEVENENAKIYELEQQMLKEQAAEREKMKINERGETRKGGGEGEGEGEREREREREGGGGGEWEGGEEEEVERKGEREGEEGEGEDENQSEGEGESYSVEPSFLLEKVVPLLGEKMYTFKAATRLYLIEWIRIIDSVPGLDLINYLPEFLDQLVRFLSDPKEDVRLKAGSALAELLREVEECAGVQELIEEDNREEGRQVEGSNDGGEANVNRPIDFATDELRKAVRRKKIRDGRRELGAIEPMKVSKSKTGEDRMKGRGVKVDYERCLAILIVHLQSNDQEILVTALRWVSSFGYICPHQLVGKTPELVHALLPLQSHSNSGIRTMAKRTNHRLQALVWVQQDGPQAQEGQSAFKASDGNGAGSNKGSDDKVKVQTKDEQPSFNYEKVFTVVELLFANNAHETTKIECMVWLLLLHKKRPEKILTNSRSGFQFLLRVLNDPSDHVAKLDLRLFAQIALHLEQQQNKQPSLMFLIDLVYNLLLLDESNANDITNVKGKGSSGNNRSKVNSVYALEFSENSADFQNSRFSLIVRQLCIVLPPEKVYRVFSAVLRCKLDSLLPHLSSYNKVETGKDGGIYRELHKTIDSENIVSGNHILSFETPNIPSDSNLAPYILLIRHLTLILACAPETLSLRLLLQPNTNNPTSKGSNISSTQPPSIATLARNSASPVSLFSNFSRKSPNLYGPFDISPSVPTGFLDFNLTLGNTNDLDGFKKRSLAMVYSNSFFESLFCGFIADPFSLLTICFLSNNFKLSHHIINKTISSGYSNNSDFLAQLDILVTLIESPSFAFLRLLLVSNPNTFLLESLFGILMLLPQSPAFATLRNRLSVVSLLPKTDPNSGTNISNSDSQLRLSSLFDHVVDSLLNM